jgi:hypothetical protein
MPEEFDIQKLLRLKRHEQPPPEYFEKFLREFHCRQREELLRQPLWRIALERMQAYIGEITLPRVAYAGATAAVLVSAGITCFNILNPTLEPSRMASLSPATHMVPGAQVSEVSRVAQLAGVTRQVAAAAIQQSPGVNAMAWNPQPLQTLQADVSTFNAAQRVNASAITTRYVIDTRPVSYEPPSSF